jgi:hypothetical protein
VRDNNFTSGGRGPLHGRRRPRRRYNNAFYSSPPPSRQRACPSQPSCCPVHRRGAIYFRWTPSSTRYRSLSCARLGQAPAPIASEMHCTTAHRLTSHTHPIRSPGSKPSRLVGSTRLTPPFSPPRRAMWRSRPGEMSLFGGQASTSCSVRRTRRAACSKTSSGHLAHLEWLPSCFSTMASTMDLTARADCTQRASTACLVL